MMAFQSTPDGASFVVSIIHNNKPVREFNDREKRVVRIPFGEEYKIRIKSKTHRRALVSVTIDGMDVLTGGKQLILDSYGSIDLERFVDDLKEGSRFKFISVEQGAKTGEIQDPTSVDNGLIRVQVYPELEMTMWTTSHCISTPLTLNSNTTYTSHNVSPTGMRGMDVGGTVSSKAYAATSSIINCSTTGSIAATNCAAPISDVGGTAAGSGSNQAFTLSTASFQTQACPVTFDIWLKGPKSDVKPERSDQLKITINQCGGYSVCLGGVNLDVRSCSISEGIAHVRCHNNLSIDTRDFILVGGVR